ncbi:hypothetical protein BKA62DRAFT_739396 [Auriculariales sp. MPI-PUGE-AT-0066]|nr:hypothetical protein BKA62DRAFT_739396 [Auriculariales sp. MPI-PUGE-AT-0066]
MPSTALNKPAEPALIALLIASRVDASCCSSCSSRMASCGYMPMDASLDDVGQCQVRHTLPHVECVRPAGLGHKRHPRLLQRV